jgi:hypothetical protein
MLLLSVVSVVIAGVALAIQLWPPPQVVPIPTGISQRVSGTTFSTDFPTMNSLQSTNGDPTNGSAFVTKIDPTGAALIYSTYSARIEFEKVYTNPADHTELKRERWTASVTYRRPQAFNRFCLHMSPTPIDKNPCRCPLQGEAVLQFHHTTAGSFCTRSRFPVC